MYIVELFIKLKNDILSDKFKKKIASQEDYEKCEHIFVPIDSTGKILACSKCGMVHKLNENDKNPFQKDS